jgi:phage tail sheath protein FI
MTHVNSWNAINSVGKGAARYKNILDSKINRFTSPLFGGFDGLDITERDPFRNTLLDAGTETTNYAYYTIQRAIDTVSDPEVLSCNIMTVPGVTNESLTKYLIDTAEGRADALGVIDVKGGFQPRHERDANIATRRGDLNAVLNNMRDRNLNNSYGCAYYPWVTIRDDINQSFVKAPPSVVALGVLANTEKAADVWFAPAGFQRGGLSQGAGGVPVLSVETKLTSRNRDDLYDININPIASFPSEGLVVFGQKTLQSTQSALDRINVRRLLIFTKKGISQIASTTLFQPNVRDTWNGFKTRAENFLSDVKVRFGVDDFKVLLDETTTTPDLVDRNIMYAKIFIKPTRAIEFIAIDFVITRSGASFED